MTAEQLPLASESLERDDNLQRLVVGFCDSSNSLLALRWAIKVAERTGASLTVVHASSFPVRVCNGPTAAVAHSIGNPTWATVHAVVKGLGAPDSTTTIIEPGRPVEVLAKYARGADAIFLGPRRSVFGIRDLQRSLERRIDVPVLRIDEVLVDDHLEYIDLEANSLLSMR